MTAKPVQEVIEEMRLRFTSGNSIPVHDARITAEEWQAVTAALSRVRELLEAKAKEWKAKEGYDSIGWTICAIELSALASTLGETK